jgi:dimethylhistidine N-methyltransferase
MDQIVEVSQFEIDTIEGLSKNQKTLKSKYFYDAKGDEIFQQIMAMPEYYLTRCEMEIFETQKEQIFQQVCPQGIPFNLIELGAGDGSKTKVLLEHFLSKEIDFTYYPVDISQHILDELVEMLCDEFPDLDVVPLNMDYFEALKKMEQFGDRKNITMFLGSNIGNFESKQLEGFLTHLQGHFKSNDKLLLGVDLKKDPEVILNAYNDKNGITAAFNMNLLKRMNIEFDANFSMTNFKHYALYEPITGEARSYIVSLELQTVRFDKLDFEVQFEAGECIHTEISRKYSVENLSSLAIKCGFKIAKNFYDSKNYYVNSMWDVE